MNRSAVRRRVAVPSTSTSKVRSRPFQYEKGLDTNSTNDNVKPGFLRRITDAREPQVGKWETRQGNDFLSIPIGEAINVQHADLTGAANFDFSTTTWFSQPMVATANGRLTYLEARIRNVSGGTGTVILALYTDNAGSPGVELIRTSIAASQITNSYQYLRARSITCPDIVSGTTYHVVGYVQAGGTGSYQVSTTTAVPLGKASADAGVTFAAQTFGFNVKLATATAGRVKGLIRFRRPNGTRFTVMAHGSSVYSIDEATGATTVIDSGISAQSTQVRFDFTGDVLRYTDGVGNPRKYDFTAAIVISAALEVPSIIMQHKVFMFYVSAVDRNKLFFSEAGQGKFDLFPSTHFDFFPAPKTADEITALAKLQGSMFVITRNNKYVYSGYNRSTFQIDNAVGQKGTFSQESVASNEDYIFLASDDGIYQFNGAEEKNILGDEDRPGVLDWWTGLLNKQNTILSLHGNRLYVFYTPNGESRNTRCMVYHTVYRIWESDDTKAYVNGTYSSADATGEYFIQASNRVGMLMLAEQSTNDYNTMGEPLSYEIRTHYDHYGSPAQLKRAPEFRPHFDSVTGKHSITFGYATDYSDSPSTTDIPLSGSGPRFNTGVKFNSGVKFGGTQHINPQDSAPRINGTFRRLQLRFSHSAAREKVNYDGHAMSLESQRMN